MNKYDYYAVGGCYAVLGLACVLYLLTGVTVVLIVGAFPGMVMFFTALVMHARDTAQFVIDQLERFNNAGR